MKMDIEKADALVELSKHYGVPVLFEVMDTIIHDMMKQNNTLPLSGDPMKDGQKLLGARMMVEGAEKLKSVLKNKLQECKQGGSR